MLLRSEGGAAILNHGTLPPPANIAAPVESAGYSGGVRREAHRLSGLTMALPISSDPPSMAALPGIHGSDGSEQWPRHTLLRAPKCPLRAGRQRVEWCGRISAAPSFLSSNFDPNS